MTSVTISTTVTYDTGSAGNGGGGNYGNYQPRQPGADDREDIGGKPRQQGGNGSVDAVLNNMNIPEGIKDLLRKVLASGGGEILPSEASAVDTVQKFQNDNKGKLGLISSDQMRDVVSGKTDSVNGVKVPDNVKQAFETYLANNGALFDKVESATNGKHDGKLSPGDADKVDRSELSRQPTITGTSPDSFMRACANNHISPNDPEDYEAVKTMGKFQKDNDIKLISYDQMKQIASGQLKELNGKPIPEEVRDAAKVYVADHGALFDKIESATDGKHDSQLSAGDADKAVKNGLVNVPPLSEKGAVATMEAFQKEGGPKHVSYDQMLGIASGDITKLGGKEITPEVKAAAQAYVANNGALFDKIEAATDGKHDSRLGAGDPEQARKKGITLSDVAPAGNGNNSNSVNVRPGDSIHIEIDMRGGPGNKPVHDRQDVPVQNPTRQPVGEQKSAAETKAVEVMEKFQNGGGPRLVSYDQMKAIASGEITKLGGKEITPEVKAAAQTYVANNGALFDKMEAATDGKHDSKLGAGDPAQGRKKDLIDMSESKAVDTIAGLQSNPWKMMGYGMKPDSTISFDQLKEMADKGTLNGRPVSGNVKEAAETYVANNGALFDKVESLTNGKHDSQLSVGDARKSRDQDLLNA